MMGPIPGQSLTGEPGAPQYERPPRLNTQDEALDAYVEKFDDSDTRDALFQMLETGAPLSSVVTLLTREAVRNGVHSMDLAIVLRPMVHEYLSALADAAGVDYEEDVLDEPKRKSVDKNEKKAIAALVKKQLDRTQPEEDDRSNALSEEAMMEEPMQEEQPAPEAAGLMQRPQMGMM